MDKPSSLGTARFLGEEALRGWAFNGIEGTPMGFKLQELGLRRF